VAAVKTYKVHAKRWARGWELHIDGVGVTQSHGLADAAGMARSYIAMTRNVAADSFNLDIVPEVGDGLDEAATAAREAVRAAEEAQRGAAARSRNVARQLKDMGLTGRDIAALLQLSPQRVSQLLRPSSVSSSNGKKRDRRKQVSTRNVA
jgi:hypothetical protein